MRARVLQVVAAVVLMFGTAQSSSAQSMRETIEATLPRIVKIFGAGGVRNLEAYGTGFLISPEGHVATVWSHVLDREEVIAVLNDGQRLPANLVGFEPQLDLAILKLEGESLSLPYFDLGQFGQAGPGTRVLGFSNIEAATWNAVLLGIAIVVLEFSDVLVPDPWPERVSLPVGLWVMVSPIVLSFTSDVAATLSTAFTGVLVAGMSASAIWAERRKALSRL